MSDEQQSSLVFLQYLTNVFDGITDGVLLIDVIKSDTFKLAMANKTFYDFSGYSRDSLGKNVADIVPPASYSFLVRQYKKVVRTKKPLQYLRWSEVPIGQRAYEVRMVPVFNTTGDCVQIVCIVHDATEMEQLREEVERLRGTVRGIRSSV